MKSVSNCQATVKYKGHEDFASEGQLVRGGCRNWIYIIFANKLHKTD